MTILPYLRQVYMALAAVKLKNPFIRVFFVKLVNRECLMLNFPLPLLCFVYVYDIRASALTTRRQILRQ